MTAVAAVIPSFNRPEATERAVRSALAQTGPLAEIVVVDDASTPPLDQAALEALDPRVHVHRLEANRGAAGARQFGVEASRSPLLAFLDSDDLWLPGKLVAQLPLVSGGRLVAASCGWEERAPGGHTLRRRVPAEAEGAAFARGCWFNPGSTVMVPRAAFERVGPFDVALRRLEDLDWFARFGREGGRLRVWSGLGAVIGRGARARRAPVEAAARRILATLGPTLDNADRRALRAWLHVERARAALNERAHGAAADALLRSLLLAPRLRLQLGSWWTAPHDHVASASNETV